jgi:hypothetical protein
MNKKIPCISCRYARPDPRASEGGWTAYECGNPESEYHKALLNVTPSGEKQYRITWCGCKCGERRSRS